MVSHFNVVFTSCNTLQVGGNRAAWEFFSSQPDISEGMSIQKKYQTKAAALYRDKVRLFLKHFQLYKYCTCRSVH